MDRKNKRTENEKNFMQMEKLTPGEIEIIKKIKSRQKVEKMKAKKWTQMELELEKF